MKGSQILQEGITNWKLRLVLSALLCLMGLGALISMVLGLFVELSVMDKSIVGIAIFMVGTPVYLISSKLGNIDQYTIAGFLNEELQEVEGDAEVLVKSESELNEDEISRRKQLEAFFDEHPLHTFLPDKPVKQAWILFTLSFIGSVAVWFIS
ncbi:hypothetical protein [Gracilimonas mengyeensis]|uniref:Uncharacterized protein n=1 Tax=Gracilimonas mengyeensis TaxID=1302730 RepID=A0A521BWW2_9BACT|nr:hypothetical protein [Gracilimonas mengyeensis]SMO51565.1 hypothetical protein SAMN06265219_103162 [Gracilimonas mengyeensis]